MKQLFGTGSDGISIYLTSGSVPTPTTCAFIPGALICLLFDVTPPHDSFFFALLGLIISPVKWASVRCRFNFKLIKKEG